MVKQVPPLERKEEEKKERVEYKPVVAGGDRVSKDLVYCICCSIMIIIMVIVYFVFGPYKPANITFW